MDRGFLGCGPKPTKAASHQRLAAPGMRIGVRITHPSVRVIWPAEAIIASGMLSSPAKRLARMLAMAASSIKPVRCAIYTRKSTEHGLELEFNSLDAQRDACEAYIKSQ